MANRMFDNPYSAAPGVHEGRTCILILDENGKPTGKYCFSEESATRIISRLEAAEAADKPAARATMRVLGSAGGSAISLGRHKVYGLFVTDGTTTASVPKRMSEEDVTLDVADKLLAAKRMRSPEVMAAQTPDEDYLYTAGNVARFGLTFPAHISRPPDVELYARPLLRDLQMLPAPAGHAYSKVDAARLLDRKDAQAARYVLTLFLRMFERQVEDERRSGDARYTNKRGFNKGDSTVATKLVQYMRSQGLITTSPEGLLMPVGKVVVPAGIHQNMADILSGYLVQVVDIMNEGATRTGKVVRTNPRRRAKNNPRNSEALRKKYRQLRSEALSEFAHKSGDRNLITEEDEREFDNAVREMLLAGGLPTSVENYVGAARSMYKHARSMPYKK